MFDPAYPGARIPLKFTYSSTGRCCWQQNVDPQGEQKFMVKLSVEPGAKDMGADPAGHHWRKTDSLIVITAQKDWYTSPNDTISAFRSRVSFLGKNGTVDAWANYSQYTIGGLTDADYNFPNGQPLNLKTCPANCRPGQFPQFRL
jgi:hypothetical protein